jgi:hypothetical protein
MKNRRAVGRALRRVYECHQTLEAEIPAIWPPADTVATEIEIKAGVYVSRRGPSLVVKSAAATFICTRNQHPLYRPFQRSR